MRLPPQTIHLGEQSWSVRPLTLAQVQAIEPLLFDRYPTGTVTAAVAIIRLALARDHAEAAATLDTVEAGAPDIAKAMAQVLRLGGFIANDQENAAQENATRGEAQGLEGGSG